MPHRRVIHWAAVLIFGSALAPVAIAETPTPVNSQAERARQLRRDLEFLASDDLRGRSVGDESIDQAAEYIADRMARIGLDVTAADGTPFQSLDVSLGARAGAAVDNQVRLQSTNEAFETIQASLAEGMNPMAIGSGSGDVDGPVVFAGYGITAPRMNYDDYAGVDVQGATVVILRKEPRVNDPRSPFAGTRNTRHAYFQTKIDNAISHGAAAVILVNDPGSVLQDVQNERNKIQQEQSRRERIVKQIDDLPEQAINSRNTLEQKLQGVDSMLASLQDGLRRAERGVLEISVAGQRGDGKDSIPVVSVARDLVDQLLLHSTAKSLESLEQAIDETTAPSSMLLPNVRAKISVSLKPTIAPTKNVIGVLPGHGPLSGETIVLGAHYDHVGMGGFGSLAPGTVAIHNGADDNASGTVAMLAIASRLIGDLTTADSHRRVVFIAFTGEERGLLGSKHYVGNPLFPLKSTSVMVNLDMVGRLRDNELTVYGTGSGDLLDEVVELANKKHQFQLFKVRTGYGPSDHQSFYQAGVPVLFFFTGLHNDYHRPSDDIGKIDFGGMTRITDIVSEVTFELATRVERPKYAETENRVRIRRQLTAFMGVTLSDRDDHVVLSELTSDGPAEKSNLQVGDRLEKLANRRVRSSEDVLEIMRTKSPGDLLKVEVTRAGKTIQTTVKLEPRR